ncbi:DUF2244 domain-containing protein [Alteromonas lipolytica]|uniref:DUF2244 domain-containing protein n=1 Tax=Alteromonas lipolytica TaxID=1856405 RepID=A0A1E8FGX0_9ALTE|nr:DUF2244 domain-containing protein [Alteromonas lipolytica]OFI34703.1 hypothetical protein BFC17_14065 [Alteromonas lipolytica]GGF53285.1 hypothetical protein GCM10011338_01800 [Alteromonas lipolytica]
MVLVKHLSQYSLITLRPNRSADWLHNKWLMLGMAIIAFMIACAWAWVGVWMVFPFAGIEISLLCFMLYRVSLRSYHSETLSFEKDYVHIQRSTRQSSVITLNRNDVHLEMTESAQDWYLPQVTLVTPNHNIAVGEFLNQADRQELYREIKKMGVPAWRHHWWKH